MNLQQTLEDYISVSKLLGKKTETALPPMNLVALGFDRHRSLSQDEVIRALGEISIRDGWFMHQSKTLVHHNNDRVLPLEGAAHGLLLAAEAVTTVGHSLSVRQQGDSTWLMTTSWEIPRDDLSAGELLLVSGVRHLTHEQDFKGAYYRRYWQIGLGEGVEPYFARFVGFGSDKGDAA